MNNGNEPAYPGGIQAAPTAHDDCPPTQPGLTKREYLFKSVLCALLVKHPSSCSSDQAVLIDRAWAITNKVYPEAP